MQINDPAELLVGAPLRAAEQAVVDATRRGEWAELAGARIRSEVIAALLLSGAVREGLAAPAVRVRDAELTGVLDLSFAEVAVPLRLERCSFDTIPQLIGTMMRTVDLGGCTLPGLEGRLLTVRGDLRLSDAVLTGPIRLENAQISGSLAVSRATVSVPGGRALSGGGLIVGGGLFGRGGLRIEGETRLIGAQIEGGVLLEGAQFSNPGGTALCLDELVTNRLMCSDGFRTDGEITMRNARVSGEVNFRGATLHAPQRALRARGTTAGELVMIPGSVHGLVDLTRVRVGALRDSEASWPSWLRLDGFEYEHLLPVGPAVDAAARCRWLSHNSESYRPQPYEQLAAYYRRLGHDDDARRVLLVKERRRRGTLPPVPRAAGYLLDAVVGYGYRPWLATVWLALLLALGTSVFAAWPPAPVDPVHEPHFGPLIYSLDLLIPIGAFGLRAAYDPDGATQWVADLLIAAGWLLATALVTGVSRTFGRD